MTRCKAFTNEGKPCQNFVGKNKKLYCSKHSEKSIQTKPKKTTTTPKTTTPTYLPRPTQRKIVQKGG